MASFGIKGGPRPLQLQAQTVQEAVSKPVIRIISSVNVNDVSNVNDISSVNVLSVERIALVQRAVPVEVLRPKGPRGRKASLSTSPLARPKSAIYALAGQFQTYLHFPDPSPLYALMGALAAGMMKGNSVWLMLIGPPGCGKSALLSSIMGIDGVIPASSIRGEQALLSGTPKREQSKAATGGLLRQLPSHSDGRGYGALMLKDFTSVLEMNPEAMRDVMKALRESYDGRWDRDVGSDGGTKLTWEGKMSMLSGCTQAIDQHHRIGAEMGERWIYYRYNQSTGYQEGISALNNLDSESSGSYLRDIVSSFFYGLDLSFEHPVDRRLLKYVERTRIIAMATLASRGRSAVIRDGRTREVEDVPFPESPTRLITIFGQLYLGLEIIGLSATERWAVLGKIALDCMPCQRRDALQLAMDTDKEHEGKYVLTYDEFQARLRCSMTTTKRVVEDLRLHGLMSREGTNSKLWGVSEWAKGELKKGWER